MKHGVSLLREIVTQNSGSSEFCPSTGPSADAIYRLYSLFRQPVTVFHQSHSKKSQVVPDFPFVPIFM